MYKALNCHIITQKIKVLIYGNKSKDSTFLTLILFSLQNVICTIRDNTNIVVFARAVLFKPKRNKFMSLPVSSVDSLISAISDALGGGGTWNKAAELEFGRGLGTHEEL